MKCDYAWLKKEFSKIRDEITRNYVLSTLAKSDKELQQLKQDILNPDGTIKNAGDIPVIKLILKILGDIPRKEENQQ